MKKAFKNHRPSEDEWRAAVDALPPDTQPLDFGAGWNALRLFGSSICMNMLTDHFYTDPELVAKVKAAALRGARQAQIREILERG